MCVFSTRCVLCLVKDICIYRVYLKICYICLVIEKYIYIYIYREREREN